MCTIAQRFWLDPTTVGALPAAAAANQSPDIPPRPPYTQPGRITSPRTAFACNTSCSCAGRQATSLIESSGLVSSTSLSPVLPWTQTPLVKISVLGCDPRRPASIKASTAVLSLATALAEDSKAACTRTRHSSAVSARSEEHTSELQSHSDLVCRLLLEKKKT